MQDKITELFEQISTFEDKLAEAADEIYQLVLDRDKTAEMYRAELAGLRHYNSELMRQAAEREKTNTILTLELLALTKQLAVAVEALEIVTMHDPCQHDDKTCAGFMTVSYSNAKEALSKIRGSHDA